MPQPVSGTLQSAAPYHPVRQSKSSWPISCLQRPPFWHGRVHAVKGMGVQGCGGANERQAAGAGSAAAHDVRCIMHEVRGRAARALFWLCKRTLSPAKITQPQCKEKSAGTHGSSQGSLGLGWGWVGVQNEAFAMMTHGW